MSSYIPAELRRLVRARARGLCEYCLLHEADTYLGNAVDHVISEKHGGQTVEQNLAFSCQPCNRRKGTDVASVVPGTDGVVRFFNPRRDKWRDHFALVGFEIVAITPVGEATARILDFNAPNRLEERQALMEEGRFPTATANEIMRR
jgi:hypothetical protein